MSLSQDMRVESARRVEAMAAAFKAGASAEATDDPLTFDKGEWLKRVASQPIQDSDLLLINVGPLVETEIQTRHTEFMTRWRSGDRPEVSEGRYLTAVERQAAYEEHVRSQPSAR